MKHKSIKWQHNTALDGQEGLNMFNGTNLTFDSDVDHDT